MSKKKTEKRTFRIRWFILIETVLAALLAVLIFLMLQGKNGKKPEKISIIVQNSGDEQWNAFKYGLEMAAEDENIKLSYVSTSANMTLEDEIELISGEIENGCSAFIIQPAADENTEEKLRGYRERYPMVFIRQTGIMDESQTSFPVFKLDDYNMGMALAQEILNDNDGKLDGKTLGILSDASGAESVVVREKGLRAGLVDSGVKISWSLTDNTLQNGYVNQEKVDIVVALDDISMRKVGEDYMLSEAKDRKLYGIGSSMKAVYYLDTGIAECLVVPDGFNMGYNSIVAIVGKLKGEVGAIENKTVEYKIIRKDTLFSEENQKLLFIMNQ